MIRQHIHVVPLFGVRIAPVELPPYDRHDRTIHEWNRRARLYNGGKLS